MKKLRLNTFETRDLLLRLNVDWNRIEKENNTICYYNRRGEIIAIEVYMNGFPSFIIIAA